MKLFDLSVADLAAAVGGSIQGDSTTRLTGVSPLEEAGPNDVTFFAPNKQSQQARLLSAAERSAAGAILVKDFVPSITATQIKVHHPYAAIIGILERFLERPRPESGIAKTAVIDPSATIGEDVSVGEYVVIGPDCSIGDRSILHPHVVLYRGVQLGNDCEIHANVVLREYVRLGAHCGIQPGAVIGGEGFGYIPDKELGHRRVPHCGSVHLSDRVDVGSNSSINRATLGETRVGRSTKIDSMVQIGHNNQIGERTLICGVVGMAGSCTIGNDVVLGGHVGIADHIEIADKVRVSGKSGVGIDLPVKGDYMGFPAPVLVKQFWRSHAIVQRLPELLRRLRKLEVQAANNGVRSTDLSEANETTEDLG